MRGRRRLVLGLTGLGLAVLAVFAIAAREAILERFYLSRLESSTESTRAAVLERLEALGSVKLAARLLGESPYRPGSESRKIIARTLQNRGSAGAPRLVAELGGGPWSSRMELCATLDAIEAPEAYAAAFAAPALYEADPAVRRWGLEAISRSHAKSLEHSKRIAELKTDPDPEVKLWAEIALKKIELRK